MGIVSSQFDYREKTDHEKLRKSYERLAESVSDSSIELRFGADDLEMADGAVRACIRYCGGEIGKIPEDVTDIGERIDYMCRTSGVMHRTVQLEEKWYKNAFGAMLGRLKTGEIIALLPKGSKGYSCRNPFNGKTVELSKDTEDYFEDKAELFYPTFPAKEMHFTDLYRFLLRRLDKADIYLVIIAAVLSAIAGLLPAYVSALAYGRVAPSGQSRLIAPMVALLFGVSASTILLKMNRNLVINRISIKLSTYAEAATFSRMLSLPTSFFRKYSPGNLSYRQAKMVTVVESLVNILLSGILTFLLSLLYIVQISYYINSMVLHVILIVFIQCLIIYVYLRISIKYERDTQSANSSLFGTQNSLLRGVQKLKLAGAEDRAFSVWANGYANYAESIYRRPWVLYTAEALITFVGMAGTIVIYYVAYDKNIPIKNFMAFNTAYGQIVAAVAGVTLIMRRIVSTISSLEILRPILETVPETQDDKPSVQNVVGSVDITDISFRYGDDTPWILKNLSMHINPGEYVGIVGKSGSGKSTLIRILMGFENPQYGTVMYDTYNIKDVNLQSLRTKAMTVVMQDSKLVRGDIYHNIILSTTNATLEDAWEAAEIAGIADDIRKMPMGMNTLVSENGGGISGGQRQRIIIARAVCSKRKILIMDEATSALDNISQKHVADSLASLKCTRIVVAHRLSTIMHCDKIFVLDKGNVAEVGTYDELIEKNGIFAELVAKQRLDGD